MEKCTGCGAGFHQDSAHSPGFLPNVALMQRQWMEKWNRFALKAPQKTRRHELTRLEKLRILRRYELPLEPASVELDVAESPQPPSPPPELICQRCFNLRNSNSIADSRLQTQWGSQERMLLEAHLASRLSLIVLIVDALDFPSSWPRDLPPLSAARAAALVVVNKIDLIPVSQREHLRLYVKREAEKRIGSKLAALILASAKTREGVDQLIAAMKEHKNDAGSVLFIGNMNTGKSSLWNSVLSKASADIGTVVTKATTSLQPGTTAGIIKLPLSKINPIFASDKGFVFDTPGLADANNFAHVMTFDELKVAAPTRTLFPDCYKLCSSRSLFIGGLVKVEIECSDPDSNVIVTAFINRGIPVHVTSKQAADALYAKHAGNSNTIFFPPIGGPLRMAVFPPLKLTLEFPFEWDRHHVACSEVVLPGLGWMAFSGKAQAAVRVFAPEGISLRVRSPVFPSFISEGLHVPLAGRKKLYYHALEKRRQRSQQ